MILIAHSFFLRQDPKQFQRHKPYPPLTSLIAAAILRDAGHDVSVFDATFAAEGDFTEMLDRVQPSIVLLIEDNFNYITKMCTERRRQAALAMIAAARQRGCRVAVNGPDPSDHPSFYLAAGADAVLTGEGEFGVREVVAALDTGGDALSRTCGLVVADPHGGLLATPPRLLQQEIDWLPLPAWDLIDIEAYRNEWTAAHGYFSMNMAASRGCPYKCNWCAKPTFGRRYVQRSPELVAEEMRRLKHEIRADHIWFADDIFGLSREWIEAFAEAVLRRGAGLPFMIQSRVNLIDARVAAALAFAGADEVWLGVESGSQKILDAMEKGSKVEQARVATRTLKREGIRVGWFLQLGYPSEEWEDIVLTRDLVRDEAPHEIGVSVSYPLPGTPFHDRVVAELGARRNWRDSGELAMLFQGTFDTGFYRMVRDALHAEAESGRHDDAPWQSLAVRAAAHRSPAPVHVRVAV